MKDGRKLKAVIPGGMSSPILRADEIDIRMDVDSVAAAGSMLGSGAIIVIADDTPILQVLRKVAKFYAHESCGQCTPCRLGTSWIHKTVERMASGRGAAGDVDALLRLTANIQGRTLCPMGDAAAMPVSAIARKFRAELESGIERAGVRP
jgi:NADH-quinone oxidoreductase subunit F